MLELTVSELERMPGNDIGTSGWLHVEQPRIDAFADATEDHQWIHVDPDRAAAGPFGRTIAHGYLTLSLLPHLLTSVLSITDEARGTNYGMDRVRFTSPVQVGTQIRLVARCVDAARRPDGGLTYRLGLRVEIRDQARPAMVGESIYVTYPK